MPWSPQQQRRAEQQQHQQRDQVPGFSSGVSCGVGRSGAELPEGVYRQLREVEQETSTLTARGVQGFSARVLNREEYKTPGYGTRGGEGGEIHVVQLVEIIKKPGQSLGLYLREGNGIDRFTGVFVSRFGENSELQRCGDILRPDDQILAVNNINVREMAIDDVVLMLSIPRRLLLRTSFLKSQREQQTMRGPVERIERPVVVFQKASDSERRDSEASSSGILSKPASTAASWLGRKVRQQQQKRQQTESATERLDQQRLFGEQQQQQQQQQIRHRQYPNPQQQQQQIRAHQQGVMPPFSGANSALDQRTSGSGDAVPQTARIPPPRVHPIQPLALSSRPPSFFPPSSSATAAFAANPPPYTGGARQPAYASATLGRFPASASAPLQRRMFGLATSSCCGGDSPPIGNAQIGALPPSMSSSVGAARTVIGDMTENTVPMPPPHFHQKNPHHPPPYSSLHAGCATPPYQQMAPYKSNSLPRRRFQPSTMMGLSQWTNNIRWRNEFTPTGGTIRSHNAPGSSLPFYANPSPPTFPPPCGGAFSDIDVGRQRQNLLPNGSLIGGTGRTVADIFSAQEYRNWASEDEDIGGPSAGGRRSRWADMARVGSTARSNSLPPKVLMGNHLESIGGGQQQQANRMKQFPNTTQTQQQMVDGMSPAEKADILDRLHVSPLTNRRVPLRTAGPGFDVDRLSDSAGSHSLSGMLSVVIAEGRSLKVPDRVHSKQLYCVLEVDEQHRARTGISTPDQHFRWNERFDIDVLNATNASFFIYAWHPQLRHRFCHKGDIRLMDVFLMDGLSANRLFTLQLEPRGQLLLKIAFADMPRSFSRPLQPAEFGVFGQPLAWLVQQEKVEVPFVLSRLVREIARRGLDTPGLYFLCGATERKEHLRAQLNENARESDIGERPVPDGNLLTCLVKDFLRELPEPLVPTNIHTMLLDAAAVMPSSDREGNQKLVMRILDCLPTPNKNSFVFLMDHFRALLTSEPHNGLCMQRLTSVFGPLIFCSAQSVLRPSAVSSSAKMPSGYQSSVQLDPLSAQQASQTLRLLLDYWPRVTSSSSDSNSSGGGGEGREGEGTTKGKEGTAGRGQ